MEAKALHILRGIAQKQPDLVGKAFGIGQPGAEMAEHRPVSLLHGIAVPAEQRAHLLPGQLLLQPAGPVHQQQAPPGAAVQQPKPDAGGAQLRAILPQQGNNLLAVPRNGHQVRRLDPRQRRRAVEGQSLFETQRLTGDSVS